MSVERVVPSSSSTFALKLVTVAAVGLAAGAGLVGLRGSKVPTWEVMSAPAPGGGRVAFVRGSTCDDSYCETLWVGSSRDSATQVSALGAGAERCDEIAWSPDGARVAFLVDGHQLRMYDAASGTPAGQFSLVTADAHPTSRIARGVTFSETGRAVTFDDCPRGKSGCRSGLMAVPQ